MRESMHRFTPGKSEKRAKLNLFAAC